MICLRCGYCCQNYCVVIVDDPEKGLAEDNLKFREGKERCQHLRGDEPGKFLCAVHCEEWYEETPCFSHTQIESDNTNCRMGEYILNKENHGR